MNISTLDHVNIVTAQLSGLVKFYTEVLGLETGWRPDFGVNGAWLYANGTPIVHLVARISDLEVGRIEHFALRGNDLDSFLQHLDAESVESSVQGIPGTEAKSVNIHDPDGNHIEVIFGDIPPQGTEKNCD